MPTKEDLNEMPLSALCDLALLDMAWCERRGLRVDMSDWVRPEGETCAVCLAGSVLYRRDGWRDMSCAGLVPRYAYALDHCRVGDVGGALDWLDRPIRCDLNREMPVYEDDPNAWRRAFRKLIRDLKEVGL